MCKTNNVDYQREDEILLSPREDYGGITLKVEDQEQKAKSLPDGGWGWVIVGVQNLDYSIFNNKLK